MFIIYHIPGVKIGCTEDLQRRIKAQGYSLDEVEILAETDSINEAAILERKLQKQYGYRVDAISYIESCKNALKASTPEANKKKKIAAKNRENLQEYMERLRKTQKRNIYKELTTGFVGTRVDHKKRFGITNEHLWPKFLGKTKTRGKYKGMTWVIVDSRD
jgi:molecular chaperone DnaK (HSP70)